MTRTRTPPCTKLRRTISRQFSAALAAKPILIPCICLRRIPLPWMFRCFHCGLFFCPSCARRHFGDRTACPSHPL